MDDLARFLAAMFALRVGVELGHRQDQAMLATTQRDVADAHRTETLEHPARVAIVLGAMSSGGSAFWNDLISIVTAMKHARVSAAQIVEQTKKDIVEAPPA